MTRTVMKPAELVQMVLVIRLIIPQINSTSIGISEFSNLPVEKIGLIDELPDWKINRYLVKLELKLGPICNH